MLTVHAVLAIGIAASIAWHYLWQFILNRSTARETAIFDLERFAKKNSKGAKQREKRKQICVVMGGG